MPSNVLVVDDSATIRHMVKRTLHIAGLDVGEVFEASNGIEALVQLDDHEVACLVVDINMPTMNGIQLLARMKKDARFKDIPIVIASAEGSRQRIAQMEDIGAFEYLRKPFRPEQLRDVLKPLLGVVDDTGTEDSLAYSSRF
jgi:two-component system chemotaxis response regulator CheY